jgi:hypothetical protein
MALSSTNFPTSTKKRSLKSSKKKKKRKKGAWREKITFPKKKK